MVLNEEGYEEKKHADDWAIKLERQWKQRMSEGRKSKEEIGERGI